MMSGSPGWRGGFTREVARRPLTAARWEGVLGLLVIIAHQTKKSVAAHPKIKLYKYIPVFF